MLAPLVSTGVLAAADVFAPLRAAAGAGPTGAALLLAVVMGTAVAAEGPGKEPTLAAATSRAVSLVPLMPVPTRMGNVLKRVREAVARGGAALEAAFPELAALEDALPDWADLVGTESSANPTGKADAKARFAELPSAVRGAPDFVRALVAFAVFSTLEEAGPEPEGLATALKRVDEVVVDLLAATGDAAAAGVSVLNGVQAACAWAVAQGSADEGVALGAFQALAGIVPQGAFASWAAGGDAAEPFGRDAALAAVKDWIAAL